MGENILLVLIPHHGDFQKKERVLTIIKNVKIWVHDGIPFFYIIILLGGNPDAQAQKVDGSWRL